MPRWAASCLLLAVTMGAYSQKTPKPAPGQGKEQLEGHLRDLKNERLQLKNQLKKTQTQVKVVRTDLREVDRSLTDVQDKLEETTARLGTSRVEQRHLADDLSVATFKLQTKRESLRKRLRHMYMSGEGSVLEALVSSKNIGDFATRSQTYEIIAKADRELFDTFRDLQSQIAEKKQKQDALVVRINRLLADQKGQHEELQSLRQEKSSYLGQLNAKQDKLQQLIAELDEEARQIEAQIARYYATASSRPPVPKFTGRFMKPVSAPITSQFGMRMHPILHVRRLHAGIDFGAKSGTTIHVAADGVVIAASYTRGYGNMIVVDHGGGISTLYGHCSRILVSSGQHVKQGQSIGAVGSTGLSTAPHLHFEVRINGKPVNPLSYL